MPEKRVYLDLGAAIEVSKLLDKVCPIDGEGASYIDDWSDRRVAAEMGCHEVHVRNVRLKTKRKLKPPPPSPSAGERFTLLSKRLAALEACNAELLEWASSRTVQPFRRPGQGLLDLKIVKSS
jgi:hypothetical protein